MYYWPSQRKGNVTSPRIFFLGLQDHFKHANKKTRTLTLGATDLSLQDIIAVSGERVTVNFDIPPHQREKITAIRQKMLQQVEEGIPMYGATTAYGGQASRVLTQGERMARRNQAVALSEAIIHVDVSTGDPIPAPITRSAMAIRINMLLSGHSAIRVEVLEVLRDLLNKHITPIVGRYGTVSASGDLALNGRVLSALLRHPATKVWNAQGKVTAAQKELAAQGIKKIKLDPKEGLALVNGDNFSTAAAAHLVYEVACLLLVNTALSAMTIEALRGSNRDFHPLLQALRRHPGQDFAASLLRQLLAGSKLAHQEMTGHKPREVGMSVQDPYSIRCLPQFYGPDWEAIDQIWQTIETNANGVSDNPLWTSPEFVTPGEEPYQWVSGGNFLAMHMVESIDRLRKIVIHMVKQNDRHLSRLVHPALNNGLPANLSDPSAISQCVFKGLQTQMGMYEVYANLLGTQASTAFGVHEELNQDLTSHAFSSAIMTWEVLKVARLAIATNFIASVQAIDLRGGARLLSPQTRPYYDLVRKTVPYIKEEQPLGHYVELLAQQLLDPNFVLPIFSLGDEN